MAVVIGLIAVFLTVISFADRAQEKAGDLNSSGKVDISDLSILLSRFNSNNSVSDTNDDGVVNIFDLSLLLSNYGKLTKPAVANLSLQDDFESGTVSATKWYITSCKHTNGDGISIVNDPLRTGGKSAKFTVNNLDIKGSCTASVGAHAAPTENPRAQLESLDPAVYRNGDEFYVNIGTYFPADFAKFDHGYVQVAEIYGKPFASSPTLGLNVIYNRTYKFNDLELHGASINSLGETVVSPIWKANKPISYGSKWEQVTMHVKLSPDAKIGFVELWLNGVKQTFVDGTQKKYMQTLLPGKTWNSPDGTQSVIVNSYRTHDLIQGDLTLYHDDIKVGNTFDSVQPN